MLKTLLPSLIPVLVPLLIAGAKMLLPKIPRVLLPIIAPLLGGMADAVIAWAAGSSANPLMGALLGSAGVGLREIYDQSKQVLSVPPKLCLLWIAVLFLLWPALAFALTFTQTGAEVTATYTEPTTNADTPPTLLTDLARTNVYFQIGTAVPVKGPDVAATKVGGGGNITTTVTVPIGPGQQADVVFWATATDLSGNESASSVKTTLRIDRLAPAPPQ